MMLKKVRKNYTIKLRAISISPINNESTTKYKNNSQIVINMNSVVRNNYSSKLKDILP